MNLSRPVSAFVFLSLLAALGAPAAADQVFSTVSTVPMRTLPIAPPSYPIGDIYYYSPCGGGYGNYGGANGPGYGSAGVGRGFRNGSTTLTGERFYPYDIRSNGNRPYGRHGRHGGGYGNGFAGNGNGFGMNCSGQGYGGWHPHP